MAGGIEKLIKEDADINLVMAEVTVLVTAQTEMVRAIENAIAVGLTVADSNLAADHETKAADPKLLEQLMMMLKDSDTQAMLHLEQHAEVFKMHFSPARYEQINRALLEFDFEHALTLTTH